MADYRTYSTNEVRHHFSRNINWVTEDVLSEVVDALKAENEGLRCCGNCLHRWQTECDESSDGTIELSPDDMGTCCSDWKPRKAASDE
jgi:hypothetical protein